MCKERVEGNNHSSVVRSSTPGAAWHHRKASRRVAMGFAAGAPAPGHRVGYKNPGPVGCRVTQGAVWWVRARAGCMPQWPQQAAETPRRDR